MVERLLASSDQQGAGVGQVTLANQLVETLSDDGIRELRLSWCAVSEDALDVTTE